MAPRGPRLLNRERLESQYGVKWRTVLAWDRDGILRLVRLGRKCFIDREELERVIAEGGRQFAGGWRRQAPGS
jgi:hypothetical protein